MSDDELPRLYTKEELAAYLGKDSTRYIERNYTAWPHIVFAREVRFTGDHMRQILALHERGATSGTATPFAGQKTRGGRS